MVQLLKSIQAHRDKVWSVSGHATLPLLATASTDKTCNIYNLSAKKDFPLISKLEEAHQRSVRCVAFKPPLGGAESPAPPLQAPPRGGGGGGPTPSGGGAESPSADFIDLPALAAGSFDSTVSIWGIDEPEVFEDDDDDESAVYAKQMQSLLDPSNEWNLMAMIEGHENEIKAVAWNHHGNLLASCSRDKTIWIWETDPETLEEFECISVLSDHDQDIKHVTWHPTQNLLASSSYDDTVRLYRQDDADDEWGCVAVLNGHTGTVWCAGFEHPSAPSTTAGVTRLVSASDDLTVRIWKSTDTNHESARQETLPSSLKHDATEMVWELETQLPAAHVYPIYSVSWSKVSGRIVTGGSDGRIVVYQQHDGEWTVQETREGAHGVTEINCVSWCQLDSGAEVVVSAGDDGRVNIWAFD